MSPPPAEAVSRDVEAMEAQGFVVIEGLLSPSELRASREALAPHLESEQFGRNPFEGLRKQRVYSLQAVAPVFADLVEHPRVLAICEAFHAPNCLLTAAQAICIHPGEAGQALHYDDSFYPFPRPRPAISLATIVAIDDFTAENGATEVIPGSHLWGDDIPAGAVSAAEFAQHMRYGRGRFPRESRLMRRADEQAATREAHPEPVVMPAGAAIVFLGTLWHRGGANRSARPRLALSTQYCEPWARQQENFALAIPHAVARGFSERVQELLGYSIHPPFMGHARGLHPKRALHDTES